MQGQKNNITVLVAPLDWGLGHATRCIPIIRELKENGCTVLIATSGPHKNLLAQEFPDATFVELPGYVITYAKANVMLRLMLQLPRFFGNVKKEHQWLQRAVDAYKIDTVISDNRYGLHSVKVPCVFITHQLQVQSPPLFKWAEKIVRNRLYRFIRHFSACWVPDVEDKQVSLGGILSHPGRLPHIPVLYLGWLTRFLPKPQTRKKYALLISLSGPEPQRSLLEQLLLPQLADVNGKVLLARGLPGAASTLSPPSENSTIINHLPALELQTAIAQSDVFMSRCGYSTLMDLQAVQCRCIFVPTPSQTEQEYLGKQIMAAGKALVVSQNKIHLRQALEQAASLPHFSNGLYQNNDLGKIIKDWLATVKSSF